MFHSVVVRSCSLVLCLAPMVLAQVAPESKPRYAGPVDQGFLLPNGWTITPVGDQVATHDLPLHIHPLAAGGKVVMTTSGFNRHEMLLIDLQARKILDRESVGESWYGLAAVETDQEFVWSGGGGNRLFHRFLLQGDNLSIKSIPASVNEPEPKARARNSIGFRSGICFDSKRNALYTLDIEAGTVSIREPAKLKVTRTGTLGGRPYDIVLGRNGVRLFVSDWSRRQLLAVDPESLRVVAKIPVGEHPNQIVLHPKDDRLFVPCASSNGVWVYDTRRGYVIETIMTSLFPKSPEGSTPDAVAISPDGATLFVANADNNCVAVIDVARPGKSQVKGFIPTGWYPTAVAVTPDGQQLLVGVGKGNQTRANPIDKNGATAGKQEPVTRRRPYPYIGTTLSGSLAIIPIPDEKQLAEYTARVYRNCPYSDELLTNAPSAEKTVIPTKVGDPCPITHVIYIIKENRTYDQVFGDMKKGNGDPSLVMYGAAVTPNHHKLAEEFVLLDNLYCNGQVSRDGHPWSTMAYNTDYIARDWMLTYSSKNGVDDDDEGNLQKAPSGYLWDLCARSGVTYRSYGEYGRRVSAPDGTMKVEGSVPGLIGHMSPNYGTVRPDGKRMRDTDNVDVFLREFKEYEKTDSLPRFIIMSLGEDHTQGTRPGAPTPQACVASNDLALGRLVDAVSKSTYWPRIAIFVIEDDAQNGPDHVDAHRTVGLVISPYTKRQYLDSTQYSTVSMIRTMELILGLPPLSQYDAAARPMFNSFTARADLAPYHHVPAQIDLNAVNRATAYGADRSLKMDFSEYDRINDFELNEILWRDSKGADAPLPPAVRRAIAYRPISRGVGSKP